MSPDLKTSEPTRVTDVEEASGWFKIATVTPGGEKRTYKTNREEGGREAGQLKLSGSLVSISFTERNDKPNPYGGFYHDFYWYGAKVVEEASQNGADDGITRVTPTAPAKTPEEAWRIALSVGTERAVALAPHLPQAQQDFPFVWALAYEFAARIYLTPPPKPDAIEPLPVGVSSPGAYDDPNEPRDGDEIPF